MFIKNKAQKSADVIAKMLDCRSISSEAILVFPKNVVDFGFYAVS